MIVLIEHKNNHPLQELNSDITYTKLRSRKEVWQKLIAWKKKGYRLKVNISFVTMDYTLIGGFYNKLKISGSDLTLSDTRTPFNNFYINAKDIATAELAENAETNYEALNLRMRAKYLIFITPWL
ncbi:MAG: hypothetical protein LBV17_12240 [Treponema sp.]|jgi:ethanolamine utilization protein EutA (predicted chaperonin)|nr:hypothetical protein [Treponema sp.]